MRIKRKPIEDFFIEKFLTYVARQTDPSAMVIEGITDKPDLALRFDGKTIGVELSQVPSSYIVRHFHTALGPPKYKSNVVLGELLVFPFEPHRWVHKVLEDKRRKIPAYRQRIGADEMWLVLHSHCELHNWPMSKESSEATRRVESMLMLFGTRQYGSSFDRIFYIYADGTVVDLRGPNSAVPSSVSLAVGAGFPAVTEHRFSFECEVPLPSIGQRIYKHDRIEFAETVVPPVDSWMSNRDPDIVRPNFSAVATVNAVSLSLSIFKDGQKVEEGRRSTFGLEGKSVNVVVIHETSPLKTEFRPQFGEAQPALGRIMKRSIDS